MASLVDKRGVWYAVFTENYRQSWVRIGRMSKTSAKHALRTLEATREREKHGEVVDIAFHEFSTEYLNYSRTNKAVESFRRDGVSLKSLLPYFNCMLSEITPRKIEKYKIERLKSVKPRTVNIELLCLSNMLNKAVEWKHLVEAPKGVKLIKYEKKPPRFLTKDEVTLLLSHSSPQLKPILTFMLNTGIREGERARLRWEDVQGNKLLVRSSKTKSFRSVPLNKEAREALKEIKRNGEYIFSNKDESPTIHIKKSLKNACRKAGLKGVTPHTLRHTFASHLIMKGVDLRTVQRLLGHSNIQTTMIYAHLTEDHISKSVEEIY